MECYQRLFELEEGDEGQGPADGRGFAGMRRWEQLALEIAREAEAEEAVAAAQAEEDARAAREARALEDMPQGALHPANELPIEDIIAFLQFEDNGAQALPEGADLRNGRRRRNPYPAHPRARGGGDAVRNHERNRRGGNAGAAPRAGARVRPALVDDDRQQAELQRFVEMAQRDEEDDWDSDDLGDDDDRFVIR
jgi:E3 ubiquitin-protein ligase RNF14